MLRSKTFMVPGWDGPTAAPQGCKLREGKWGQQGSGAHPKLPNLPQELSGSLVSGRSWELPGLQSFPCPAGASTADCCKARGGPGVLQGCCKARAALRDATVGLL